MAIQEIEAKTILRKHDYLDTWFVSRAGMNLYRGCFHNCAYCDGRNDRYGVEGDFARHIQAKTNALELLDKELNPASHRKPYSPAFILLGGGINDSYQPAERHYRLSRGALGLIERYGFATLVLSRSVFVREDLELIQAIHHKKRAVLGVSFSTVDPLIARHFESSVASPEQRLETISIFKKAGIPCAMFLLPIMPYISDSQAAIESALSSAKTAGADYAICGGMTLKPGTQFEHFAVILNEYDPSLLSKYQELYVPTDRGEAGADYSRELSRRINAAAVKVKIPVRMPRELFGGVTRGNDYIATILDHSAYMLRLADAAVDSRTIYSRTAQIAAAMPDSLTEQLDPELYLSGFKGLGQSGSSAILEILETGTLSLYEELCAQYR